MALLMSYSVYGAAAAMVLVATVGAVSAIERSNWQSAKATVSYIDRNCQIIQTTYDADYKPKSSRTITDACSSVDEWEKVRTKRTKLVEGKAVVYLDYMIPETGQPGTAELKYTGRDDEFYELKAGDEVELLVRKNDPTKVKKA